MRDIGELYRDSEADNERFRKEISRLKVLCGDTMNQRDSFNTRLADEQADNARLRAEVERLREELSGLHPSYQSALAWLFTFVCPEESFDPTQPILMGKRIKDAVARLTGELAAVRRERESQSKCKHPYCRAACQDGEHFIKCQDCGLEWVQPCDHHMHIDLASALARNAALEEDRKSVV